MAMERLKKRIKTAFSRISIVTYVLVVIFGSGSWIAINGLWVELPIMVQEIPESWSLPSYLTVIIQLANVAPLAFTLGNKFFPRLIHEIPFIYISVIIAIISCALLAFFWRETSYVAGAERSTALLLLAFLLSMVDCSSSVTFLPYMATFREIYMSPYFAGGGLSGLLPSLVALAQGVGGGSYEPCPSPPHNNTNGTSGNGTNDESWGPGPKFSAAVFFWFLCGMMVACCLAFIGLNYLPAAKRQQVNKKKYKDPDQAALSTDQANIELVTMDEEQNARGNESPDQDGQEQQSLPKSHVFFLLVLLVTMSGLSNGVIPAIQSYASIPYSFYIYHLTLTLSNIVNPLTCFVFPLVATSSVLIITLLSTVYFGLSCYILVIALQSPNVLLQCEKSGAALIVSFQPFTYEATS